MKNTALDSQVVAASPNQQSARSALIIVCAVICGYTTTTEIGLEKTIILN